MVSKKLAQKPALDWSLKNTLDDMDAAGKTSILSATTPQVSFLDVQMAKKIARENNEYAAKIAGDHKGRFGSFAMLPLQNIDDALREIEYVFDVLKQMVLDYLPVMVINGLATLTLLLSLKS
jgi:predicted TIM-barrel fold metal-dependent hydrolase